MKAGIRNKTRAGLGVLIPLSQTLHVAFLVPRWRSESERGPKAMLVLAGAAHRWVSAELAMNGSPLQKQGKLGSRIGGRVRNRETSSGRVGAAMGGPIYALQYISCWACIGMKEALGPAQVICGLWEINTQRSHHSKQDTLKYC